MYEGAAEDQQEQWGRRVVSEHIILNICRYMAFEPRQIHLFFPLGTQGTRQKETFFFLVSSLTSLVPPAVKGTSPKIGLMTVSVTIFYFVNKF